MPLSTSVNAQRPVSGIVINYYRLDGLQVCIKETDVTRTYVAEDLCLKAARECRISMLTYHLFALATPDLSIWLPPNKMLTCPEDQVVEYVFRIRFRMPDENIPRLIQFDSQAFEYLYLQCHNDFIDDRVKQISDVYYRKGKEKLSQERCLGLGVIDMVLCAKINEWPIEELKRQTSLSQFLPESSQKSYSMPWEKIRLTTNFKKELERQFADCQNDTKQDIKLRYVMGVFNLVPEYLTEHFYLQDEIIHVNPFHTEYPGIYSTCNSRIYKAATDNSKHICKIEDVQDVSLADRHVIEDNTSGDLDQTANSSRSSEDMLIDNRMTQWIVTINRYMDFPKTLCFPTEELSLSCVTLLDGYYRLTVDFYHHISRVVQSPMLQRLRPLKCHGPVSHEWAKQKLEDKGGLKPGYHILKQGRNMGEYVLVVYQGSGKGCISVKINQNSDGTFCIANREQPHFNSMKELLAHYQNSSDVLKLTERLPAGQKEISKLLLCREGNALYVSTIRTPKTIKQAVEIVSRVNIKNLIEKGTFTQTHKGVMEKENEVIQVAVKVLRQTAKEHLEDLQHGVQRALFWRHANIVRVHAICLAPFSILLELSQFGPLNRYLQQPLYQFRVINLVQAAEQIAEAMMYLEELGAVHGNISCKNILLWNDTFVVKLSDPGLISYYNKLELNHALNVDRLPWIAPELYSGLDKMTPQSDMFAFGTTLWEMFTLGDIPLHNLNSEQKMEFMTGDNMLEWPHDHCPEDLYRLMRECWSHDPDQRPKIKSVMRDIRQLSSFESYGSDAQYNNPSWGERAESLPSQSTSNSENISPEVLANSRNHQKELEKKRKHEELKKLLMKPIGAAVHSNPAVAPSNNRPGNQTVGLNPSARSPSVASDESQSNSQTPLLPPTGRPGDFFGHVNNAVRSDSESNVDAVSPGSSHTSSQSQQTIQTLLSGQAVSPVGTGKKRPDFSSRPLPDCPVSYSQPISQPDLEYILKRDRIEITKRLGSGYYGEVKRAVLRPKQSDRNGVTKIVAVKSLHAHQYNKFSKEFEDEMKIMTKLSHPNIVKVEGMCPLKNEDTPMFLVMEFVENGCLRDFLKRNTSVTPHSQMTIAYDIAMGMEYLNEQRIVHRDLAARNVLVTKELRAKISDFGLARVLSPEKDYYRSPNTSLIPALWSAPEALEKRKFTTKSDVWSYGVTLWELYSFGKSPDSILQGQQAHELCAIYLEGRRLACPVQCPERLYKKVMRTCWEQFAENRPDFHHIVGEVKSILEHTPKGKALGRRETVS